jgi:hypothetical protein
MEYLLVRILLDKMRNETHVEYIRDVIDLVKRVGAGSIGVTALLAELEPLFATEQACFEVILRSDLTIKIEEKDHERDSLFHGLKATVSAATYHPVAAKREAATSLLATIDHYGNITRKSYDDESANIDDLLRELDTPANKALVTTVGVTDYTDRLRQVNNELIAYMHARDTEASQRPVASMKAARAAVDKVLHAMLARVESQVNLYGLTSASSDYSPFVNEWNTLAGRYNHRLAIERGRRTKKNDEL